jgi:hypothetical protein
MASMQIIYSEGANKRFSRGLSESAHNQHDRTTLHFCRKERAVWLRANRRFDWAKLTTSGLQIDGLLLSKSTVCSSEVVNFGV